MDTNLIDSCREATGEARKADNEAAGEFRAFKTNGDPNVSSELYDVELLANWNVSL